MEKMVGIKTLRGDLFRNIQEGERKSNVLT